MNRGHETSHHRYMKRVIGDYYLSRGWMVYFEEKNCDVVAWKYRPNGHIWLVGIEAERTTRNCIRNTSRDLAQGVDTVLIVVPDEKLQAAVRRLLSRNTPAEWRGKVGVAVLSAIKSKTLKTGG